MRHRCTLLLWIMGLCLVPISIMTAKAWQQPDSSATTIYHFKWVPYADTKSISVPAILADRKTHLFFLDTGANVSYLDSEVAHSLNLPVQSQTEDKNTKIDYIVSSADFGPGVLSIPQMPLVLMDMSSLRQPYPDLHGVIGLNFLDNFAVRINFSKRQLDLIHPGNVAGTSNEPKGAYRIPLIRGEDRYFVTGKLDGTPIQFAIDTGSNGYASTSIEDPILLSELKPQA